MNPKHFTWALMLGLSLAQVACDSSDDAEPQPVPETELVPVRMEYPENSRELVYDDANRLKKVITKQDALNGVVLESIQEYFYHPDGKFDYTALDDWKVVFNYEGEQITHSQEFIGDVMVQEHTFDFDDEGRLTEWITWQDIPEEGGVVPVSKNTFVYEGENETERKHYYYVPAHEKYYLLTQFTYGDYDDKICTDNFFHLHPFNPLVVTHKNNFRTATIANGTGGGLTLVKNTFQYNDEGFVVKKTLENTFNGTKSSYDTEYFYEEKPVE